MRYVCYPRHPPYARVMRGNQTIIRELEVEFGTDFPVRRIGGRLPQFPTDTDSLSFDCTFKNVFHGLFLDHKGYAVALGLSSPLNSQFTHLPKALFELTSLKVLCIFGQHISELPPEIGQLTELESLHLAKTEITELPKEIGALQNLRFLTLSKNPLSALPAEIGRLEQLEQLNLIDNEIEELPPEIGHLSNLSRLDLRNNYISQLPREVGELPPQVDIKVFANPLVSPPSDIVALGVESIKRYFDQIEKAEGKINFLMEAKLLILGEGGSGKTTFRRKVVDPHAPMPDESETTFGIEVQKWSFPTQIKVDGETYDMDFNVNFWDFGGQNIYRGTHQIFFTDKSYYVLVADSREQSTDFSYWLNTVEQLACKGSSVLILLNKKFGHEIKFDERGYRGHFGNLIKDIFELDLKHDEERLIDLQNTVKRHLRELPEIGDPLPPSWVHIRRALLDEHENFISFDRFRELCAEYDITDPDLISTLSSYYNRIGAFTHYIDDPILQDRVYLNSNWLVDTVYEVLDNPIVKKNKGRIDEEDLKHIWQSDLVFEVNKLAQLMHNFGLMYRISGCPNFVVPEHLPGEKPYDEWPHAGQPSTLHFRYEFDKYMPMGLMSRLIVALHRYIEEHDLVWHRGVNVACKGTFGEIVETYGATNTFDIRIVGSQKIQLLSIIREKFAQVLGPFRNLNYTQLVPCNCPKCLEAETPGFHDYYRLLKLREAGKPSQCPEHFELVDVAGLLSITEPVQRPQIQSLFNTSEARPLDSPPLKRKRRLRKIRRALGGLIIFIGLVAAIIEIGQAGWQYFGQSSSLPINTPVPPALSTQEVEVSNDTEIQPDSTELVPDSTTTP